MGGGFLAYQHGKNQAVGDPVRDAVYGNYFILLTLDKKLFSTMGK